MYGGASLAAVPDATNVAHTALTVIRIRSAKPAEVLTLNDTAHLPVELRTGLPVDQPI